MAEGGAPCTLSTEDAHSWTGVQPGLSGLSAPGEASGLGQLLQHQEGPIQGRQGLLGLQVPSPLGVVGCHTQTTLLQQAKGDSQPLFLQRGEELGIQGEGVVAGVQEVGLQDALHLEETGSALAGQPWRLGIKAFYPESQGLSGSWEKESDGVKEPRTLILF